MSKHEFDILGQTHTEIKPTLSPQTHIFKAQRAFEISYRYDDTKILTWTSMTRI